MMSHRWTGTCWRYLVVAGGSFAGLLVPGAEAQIRVADTKFTPDRGYFEASPEVTVSSATPGAWISWTTDGSAPPTSGGAPSPVTIAVTGSTPLRALAYLPGGGLEPSNVDTHTYILTGAPLRWSGTTLAPTGAYPTNVIASLHALPSLFIALAPADFATVRDSGTGGIGSSGGNEPYERPCSAELVYPDHPRFRGFRGFQVNAGLRPHSWVTTKRAFRLYFKRTYGPGQLDYPIFESAPWGAESATEAFDKLVLRNHSNDGWEGRWGGSTDALYLRDQFARAVQYEMDGLGSHSMWAHLFINGGYYGLYNPCERPDDDFQAAYLGGSDNDYLGINHGGVINEGADTTMYDAAWAPGDLSVPTTYQAYRDVLDVRQFSDYLVNSWYCGTHDHDWPTNGGRPQNFYGGNRNNPPTPMRHFTWDFEATLVWDAEVHAQFKRSSSVKGEVFIRSWFALVENADFMTLFADRVHRHLQQGVLRPEMSRARLQAMAAYVRPALDAERWQWGDGDDHWESRLAAADARLDTNPDDLIADLRAETYYPALDPPRFRVNGLPVTGDLVDIDVGASVGIDNLNAGGAGAIYYTVDGSDPRRPGGSVATAAYAGSDAVTGTLDTGTTVKARILQGSTWSALHQAHFRVPQDFSGLKLTEIMYHPLDEEHASNLPVDTITGDVGGEDFERARVTLAGPVSTIVSRGDRLRIFNAQVPGNNGTFTIVETDGNTVLLNQPLTDETNSPASADLLLHGERYAYIELKNTGTTTLDLTGLSFTRGVRYAFPSGTELAPGALTVIANRPWNFVERYPAVTPDGEYLGRLDPGGERLELGVFTGSPHEIQALETDTNGVSRILLANVPAGLMPGDRIEVTRTMYPVNQGCFRILAVIGNEIRVGHAFQNEAGGARATFHQTLSSVAYNDRAPWPMPADGFGFSLVPVHASSTGLPDDPAYWRASSAVHGSPGADDPAPGPRPALQITEALTHTDWPQVDAVELFNPTAGPVSLAGWWLTDDRTNPRKFALPDTVLAAGDYTVIYEDNDDNPDNNASLPPAYFGRVFSLSSHGEAVYLFAPDLSTSHGYRFDAAANGESFGRHVTSEAEELFIPRVSVTLGEPNSAPRVGPVLFSEIHYHPADSDFEFVELKNTAPANTALFNSTGEPWRVQGLSFQFPDGVTLFPGEVILLVRNSTTEAAFRTHYGVPAGTRIWLYGGSLDNGGETLSLQAPDLPDLEGTPWIPVDHVRYRDELPWPPGPDGGGPSLERISETEVANDPVNWRASLTGNGTPGQAEPPTTPLIAVDPAGFVLTVQEEDSPDHQPFQVWNAGIGTLAYTLSETSNWFSVDITSGTSANRTDPGQHQLVFDSAHLPPGDVTGTLILSATGAANTPVVLTVRLQVTERDRIAPLVHEVVPVGHAQLRVVFNETVTIATAEAIANYHLDGGVAVVNATREVDGRTVTLDTGPRTPGQLYTLTLNNITDLSGNVIAADTMLPVQQPDILVPDGLVAYWPLREGQGVQSEDASNGGHSLAVNQAAWTADGKFDYALEFDGQDSTYASGGTWSPTGSALTVCAWFKADDFGVGDARIISKATDHFEDDHTFMLSTVTDQGMVLRARLMTGGTTTTLIAGSGAFSAGEWVHGAMVYNGSTLKLFKDGMEVGRQSVSGTLDENPGVQIWLGNNPGPHPKPFDGLIDDVRIYNRALTPQELQTLYQAVPPSLPTVQVDALGSAVAEDGSQTGAVFRLTRTTFLADPLTVDLAWEGTAENGVDYTLPVQAVIPAGQAALDLPLLPVNDADPEWNESVILRILGHPAYQLGSPDAAMLTIVDDDGAVDWGAPNRPYRIALTAAATHCTHTGTVAEVDLDLGILLSARGPEQTIDTNSFLVVETDSAGQVLNSQVVFQFDPAADFHPRTRAAGRLVWMADGATPAGTTRYVHLYFAATGGAFNAPVFTPSLQRTDGISHEGQDSLRITTPHATWYYHKAGGGFASLEDADGNDWIGYHPSGNEQGNYRGIPNLAVMHPGQQLCLTTLLHHGPLKTSFRTETTDRLWSGDWALYPDDRAVFTLTQANGSYWILYEGTPGGQVNGGSDTCLRSDGRSTLLNQSWDGDISPTNGTEWACFRDGSLERSFYVAQHQDDGVTDTYWPMGGDAGMTVFGMGREAGSLNTYLSTVPRTFSFGLLATRNATTISRQLCQVTHPVVTTVNGLDIFGDTDGDGMADAWEITWFGRIDAAGGGAGEDWDNDGFSNGDEERAGTIPADPTSLLIISGITKLTGQHRITWQSVPGKHYRLLTTTNLLQGFTHVVAEDVEADAPASAHTHDGPETGHHFYRVDVK